MTRLVLILSPLAKIGATIAAVGMAFVVYHRLAGTSWAYVAGSVLFFGGAFVYFFERIRLALRRRREEKAGSGGGPA